MVWLGGVKGWGKACVKAEKRILVASWFRIACTSGV